MSARISWCLIGLVAACSPSPFVHLILDDRAQSALIINSEGGLPTLVQAQTIGTDSPLTLATVSGSERMLTVLTYDQDLDALELPAGQLDIEANGGPVPTPDRIFELDLSRAEPRAFAELDALPDALGELRLAATDPCWRAWASTSRTVPLPGSVLAVSPLDDDHVVLGTSESRAFIISETDDVEVDHGLGAGLQQIVRDSNGELWLASSLGAMIRGQPNRGFGPAPPLPSGTGALEHLVSSPPGAPFELWAATSSLAVHRLDGQGWTQIREPTGPRAERTQVRLVWLEPGRVGLLGLENTRLLEIDVSGQTEPINLVLPDRPTVDALYNALWVRDLGPVVGSRYSVFHLRSGAEWTTLSPPSRTPRPDVLVDMGGGSFVAGGESGMLLQWILPRGQCALQQNSILGKRVQFAAPIAGGFVAFTDISVGSAEITFLRPK